MDNELNLNEEYYIVRLKDMYVKDFFIKANKDSENRWSIKSDVTLTNNKEEAISIYKPDAQKIMNMLGMCAILEPLESYEE